MPYLICYKCNQSYEMESEDEAKKYNACECGQPLVYFESLEDYYEEGESKKEVTPKTQTFTEMMVSKYDFLIIIGAFFVILGLLALLGLNLFAIFLPIGGILVYYGYRKRYSWKKGDKGEKIVAEYLNDLPNCFVFHDVNLPKGMGNLDHVVVGTKGVFLIETKNYKGSYVIKGSEWFYRKGRTLVKTKSSPAKQVKRNVIFLRNFLMENDIKLEHNWINGIVAFVGGHFKIEQKTNYYFILRPSTIASYIARSRQALDNKTILALVNLLVDHSTDYFYKPEEWPAEWTQ
jgi:hypothetical protein